MSREGLAQDSRRAFERLAMDGLDLPMKSLFVSFLSLKKTKKLFHSIKPVGLDYDCLV